VASADGTLIAEGFPAGTGASTVQSTVYDSSTGTALATLPNEIVTFSDDDSRVLTVQDLNNSSQEGIYRLVNWSTGAVLWSDHLALGSSYLTRPGSGDVLVEPTSSRGPVSGSLGTLQPYTTRSSSGPTGRPCSCPRSVPRKIDRLACPGTHRDGNPRVQRRHPHRATRGCCHCFPSGRVNGRGGPRGCAGGCRQRARVAERRRPLYLKPQFGRSTTPCRTRTCDLRA